MSYEAWGDGDDGMDGCVTEERCEEAFRDGARACREMMARFVEQGGDYSTAASIRANWNPDWGKDPGRPERVAREAFDGVEDYKPLPAPPSGEQSQPSVNQREAPELAKVDPIAADAQKRVDELMTYVWITNGTLLHNPEQMARIVEEIHAEGVDSVRYIRCMEHCGVPQLNTCAATGDECPICALRGHVPSEPWTDAVDETETVTPGPQEGREP